MKAEIPDFRWIIVNYWWLLLFFTVGLTGALFATRWPEWPTNRDLSRRVSRQAHELALRATLQQQAEEKEDARLAQAEHELRLQTELAASNMRRTRMGESVNVARKAVNELQAKADKWRNIAVSLHTSELGKRLAGDEQSLREFRAIWRDPDSVSAEARSQKSQLDNLLQPVAPLLSDSNKTFSHNSHLESSIRIITEQALASLKSLTDLIDQSEVLAQKAEHAPVSKLTIDEAMDLLGKKEAAEAMARAVEAKDAARKKEEDELAQAILQSRNINASPDAKRDAVAAKAMAYSSRHVEDLAEAKSEKVQNSIRFLSRQGRCVHYSDVRPDASKRPFSLLRLQQRGALEKSEIGLWRLYDATGYPDNTAQSRPAFNTMTPQQYKDFERVQDYLRRLGYVFIELGQLEP